MDDKVYVSLQKLIASGRYDSSSEVINELLRKYKNLSLNELVELKKMTKIQFDSGCIIKHFI